MFEANDISITHQRFARFSNIQGGAGIFPYLKNHYTKNNSNIDLDIFSVYWGTF